MTLTPQNLIDDAVVECYPHIRQENISPVALLRRLTTLDREVVGFFANSAPERLSAAGTEIPIVFASNAAGYALSAAKAYSGFKYLNLDDLEFDIEIVPEGKRPSRHPAARIRGVTFYPVDPFETNWNPAEGTRAFFVGNGDAIKYRLIPEPARVTTMAQVLASPDEAESYFREALILQLLLSSSDPVPQERIQYATQSMLARRQELLFELTKRTGTSGRFGDGGPFSE